jgi:nicotianamine synthase
MSTVLTISNRIINIHRELGEALSLAPSPSVDALFSELVSIVLNTPHAIAQEVLIDKRVVEISDDLRELCARGEVLLERKWSTDITQSIDPLQKMREFPYFENYQKIVDRELGVLGQRDSHDTSSVLFVGGGPLPLSAINLATHSKTRQQSVVILDREAEACRLGGDLVQALQLENVIQIVQQDIKNYKDTAKHQTVFLAAFLGSSVSEKKEIIKRVAHDMDAGASLVIRSTTGLATLLYHPVELEWLLGVKIENVIHPDNDIINSIIVAKKP